MNEANETKGKAEHIVANPAHTLHTTAKDIAANSIGYANSPPTALEIAEWESARIATGDGGCYWTIRDPDGHLCHTTLSLTPTDAVNEWMETEHACTMAANMLRMGEGKELLPLAS